MKWYFHTKSKWSGIIRSKYMSQLLDGKAYTNYVKPKYWRKEIRIHIQRGETHFQFTCLNATVPCTFFSSTSLRLSSLLCNPSTSPRLFSTVLRSYKEREKKKKCQIWEQSFPGAHIILHTNLPFVCSCDNFHLCNFLVSKLTLLKHTHTHIHTHTHTHTHIHTHTRAHTHTRVRTRTHTHTRTWLPSAISFCSNSTCFPRTNLFFSHSTRVSTRFWGKNTRDR